jgi:hypothetical protein
MKDDGEQAGRRLPAPVIHLNEALQRNIQNHLSPAARDAPSVTHTVRHPIVSTRL